MALDLAANPDQVFNLTTFQGKDGIVTVDLGTDTQSGISYSLFATMQPAPGGIPALMEFIFWIADYDPDTRLLDKVWDGRNTKRVLIGDDRRFVLSLVCEALGHLVRMFEPSTIFYQTCDADLPDKALIKYHVVGQKLMDLGYKVWALDSYHGYKAWKAELVATA